MDHAGSDGFYPIGVVAKHIRISTHTLRYYDEIGLLKPAYVSEDTGYRYYNNGQVEAIRYILELKRYGFSLGDIKETLENPAGTLAAYRKRYFELLQEKQRIQEIADQLAVKIKQYEEDYHA